ncbi:MarR family winged helix-turn-helix transcriptional regulator [Flavobacterium psychrotrophum]|uniref:MarR family winged helix-turn-helix transcriptional regulator n=1 Tax=Flavobacterium psychrotrophum TaxID=2294119 RepID=UPI000E31D3B8|nr:MarR family transcriptional regulator [Flavobacterium psychrotrophum]
MKKTDSLKLENQLCFPLYAASRLVTKCYQPALTALGITYPQYLVLLVLWEQDVINVSVISKKLELQSNTLTPLLKRMQDMELINRTRSDKDERNVMISLTEKGKNLKTDAHLVQNTLIDNIGISEDEAQQLHGLLNKLLQSINI